MSRIKEIIKIRAKINKTGSKNTIQKTNESKCWFFKKINKTEKHLTRIVEKKRERTQINRIRNEREVTTDIKEIQRIVRKYYKHRYANKLDNLEEMDKFLKKHHLPKQNQEESENLNRPITTNEIETVKEKSCQQTGVLDCMASQVNFTKHLKN